MVDDRGRTNRGILDVDRLVGPVRSRGAKSRAIKSLLQSWAPCNCPAVAAGFPAAALELTTPSPSHLRSPGRREKKSMGGTLRVPAGLGRRGRPHRLCRRSAGRGQAMRKEHPSTSHSRGTKILVHPFYIASRASLPLLLAPTSVVRISSSSLPPQPYIRLVGRLSIPPRVGFPCFPFSIFGFLLWVSSLGFSRRCVPRTYQSLKPLVLRSNTTHDSTKEQQPHTPTYEDAAFHIVGVGAQRHGSRGTRFPRPQPGGRQSRRHRDRVRVLYYARPQGSAKQNDVGSASLRSLQGRAPNRYEPPSVSPLLTSRVRADTDRPQE